MSEVTLIPTNDELAKLKFVDWNDLSKMGLIERINKEIMHPLGLAVTREVASGISLGALVATDGVWKYSDDRTSLIKPDDEVRELIPLTAKDWPDIKDEERYKRFIVFTLLAYDSSGGMDDTSVEQSFASLEEAQRYVDKERQRRYFDGYRIFDCVNRCIVE